MKNFELRNYLLITINEALRTTPIVLDSIQIDKLYRKNDTKGNTSNYIEFEEVDTWQEVGTTKDKQEIDLYFTCISTNEIMTDRIRWAFKLLLNNIEDHEFNLTNIRVNQGIARINNSRYAGKVVATRRERTAFK